jgi:hypothetical protein
VYFDPACVQIQLQPVFAEPFELVCDPGSPQLTFFLEVVSDISNNGKYMYAESQGNFLLVVPQPVYRMYSAPLNENNPAYLSTFNDVCNLLSVDLFQSYSQYGIRFVNAHYVGDDELPDDIIFEFSQYTVHNSLQTMFCNMMDGFLECNAYEQIKIFVWCDYSTFKELVISDVAGLAQWPSDCGQTQLRGIPATSIA